MRLQSSIHFKKLTNNVAKPGTIINLPWDLDIVGKFGGPGTKKAQVNKLSLSIINYQFSYQLCSQTGRSPDCHTVQCGCFKWGLLLQSIHMNVESSVFYTGPAHLVTVVDISLPAVSCLPFPLPSWHRTSQTLSIVSCPDIQSLYFVDIIWICAINFVFCLWNSVPGPDATFLTVDKPR